MGPNSIAQLVQDPEQGPACERALGGQMPQFTLAGHLASDAVSMTIDTVYYHGILLLLFSYLYSNRSSDGSDWTQGSQKF